MSMSTTHLLPSDVRYSLNLAGLTDNMLSVLDQDATRETVDWFAMRIRNQGPDGGRGSNPANFRVPAGFPKVFEANGTRKLGSYLGLVRFTVPVQTWEVGVEFNDDDIMPTPRPEVAETLDLASRQWGPAMANHELGLVMQVIRENPTTWDGKRLFTSNTAPHLHPIPELGEFGNSVDLGTRFVDVLNPTEAEMVALISEGARGLSDQQTTLLSQARRETGRRIGIMVHHSGHREVLGNILDRGAYVNDAGTEVRLGWKHKLEMLTDPVGPSASSGANLQIVMQDLDSPIKPVALLEDAPLQIKTWMQDRKHVIGGQASFSVKPLFPHSIWAARNLFGG